MAPLAGQQKGHLVHKIFASKPFAMQSWQQRAGYSPLNAAYLRNKGMEHKDFWPVQ